MLRQIGIARNARGHNQQKKSFFLLVNICVKNGYFFPKIAIFYH